MQMPNLDDILTDLKSNICERRLVDAELDEICCDFESLTFDYKRAEQLGGEEASRQKIVIHESLEALEQEIRRKLRRYEERD